MVWKANACIDRHDRPWTWIFKPFASWLCPKRTTNSTRLQGWNALTLPCNQNAAIFPGELSALSSWRWFFQHLVELPQHKHEAGWASAWKADLTHWKIFEWSYWWWLVSDKSWLARNKSLFGVMSVASSGLFRDSRACQDFHVSVPKMNMALKNNGDLKKTCVCE